jgi:hypothetical protein
MTARFSLTMDSPMLQSSLAEMHRQKKRFDVLMV